MSDFLTGWVISNSTSEDPTHSVIFSCIDVLIEPFGFYNWFIDPLFPQQWQKQWWHTCPHDKHKSCMQNLHSALIKNQSIHILQYFLYMHQGYGYCWISHCKLVYKICACHTSIKIMVTFMVPWSTMNMEQKIWTNQKHSMSMYIHTDKLSVFLWYKSA